MFTVFKPFFVSTERYMIRCMRNYFNTKHWHSLFGKSTHHNSCSISCSQADLDLEKRVIFGMKSFKISAHYTWNIMVWLYFILFQIDLHFLLLPELFPLMITMSYWTFFLQLINYLFSNFICGFVLDSYISCLSFNTFDPFFQWILALDGMSKSVLSAMGEDIQLKFSWLNLR